MRALYLERRDVLLDALARELGDRLRLGPADTGMHLSGWLPPGTDDVAIESRAMARGVELRALSRYYAGPAKKSGLVLGYSGVPPVEIRRAAKILREVARGEG